MERKQVVINLPVSILAEIGPDCDGDDWELERILFVDIEDGPEISQYSHKGTTLKQLLMDEPEMVLRAYRAGLMEVER